MITHDLDIEENPKTGMVLVRINRGYGSYEILLSPKDAREVARKLKRPRKTRYRAVRNLPKLMAITRIWRGDTYSFPKLRKAIVSFAMPDLARALNREL